MLHVPVELIHHRLGLAGGLDVQSAHGIVHSFSSTCAARPAGGILSVFSIPDFCGKCNKELCSFSADIVKFLSGFSRGLYRFLYIATGHIRREWLRTFQGEAIAPKSIFKVALRQTIDHIGCNRVGGNGIPQPILIQLLHTVNRTFQVCHFHGNHQFFIFQTAEFSVSKAGD